MGDYTNNEYRITTTVKTAWFDNEHKAGPEGIDPADESDTMKKFGFMRRVPEEPWFKLLALVGDSDTPIAIGKSDIVQPYKSGRLYLFVNDVFGCYYNNKGTATIRVTYRRKVN